MTRFLLSLDDAVDTVFAAIREGHRGETFVPRAPAAKVVDVAKALIGDRAIETRVTGIRPGEKIHEIMVSEEEAYRTVERGRYYAILPMLPEVLQPEDAQWKPARTAEYSSADSVMNFEQTRELLRRHNLLLDDDPQADPAKVQLAGAMTGDLLR
jgi:UDP-glucose 4-epimerase